MKLSLAMQKALDDAALAPLHRNRHGWANTGHRGHSPGTVEALERRGLLSIDRMAGCAGSAFISPAGRQALKQQERTRP